MEFEELIKKNMSLFRIYSKKYSSNNIDYAEDLLQDAFIKAFNAFDNLDKYKKDNYFIAWMISIIKNCAIDKSRSSEQKFRIKNISIDYNPFEDSYSLLETMEQNSFCDIEQMIDFNHNIDQIKNMNDEDSKVFLMKMDGYSKYEIMEKFNKSESGIKTSIFRVRNKLVPNRKKIR